MEITYPHEIENCVGEKIIFKSLVQLNEGSKLELEAFCKPKSGPAMHTHFLQDEQLTVISGTMGYQFIGQEPQLAKVGETVFFKRGIAHKFWAEGNDPLHCKGSIFPANSVVYFLSAVYAAQNKAGKAEPEPFDGAYLLTKYASEYDMPEIPQFVKKVIFPITVFLGNLFGKYKHFKDAPDALK